MKKSILGALCCLAVGCGGGGGGGPVGEISGKVKLDGKSLTQGQVIFLTGKKKYESAIGADGTYKLANVPAGIAKIAVFVPGAGPNINIPDDPNMKFGPPKGVPPEALKTYGGLKQKSQGPTVTIPSHYNDPEKSQLTYEVKPGPQVHDIDLKP